MDSGYYNPGSPLNVFLGWEASAGSPAFFDMLSENSPSGVITGSSGSGKTNLGRHLMNQLSTRGMNLLIFDFHGDFTCDSIPSISLSDGPHGEASIRPLGFSEFARKEYGLDGLADTVISVIEASGRVLGAAQEPVLRKAVKITLEKGKTGLKDVQDSLEELKKACDDKKGKEVVASVISRIERLSERNVFSHEVELRPSRILDEPLRIDCSGLSDVTRGITLNMILSLVSHEIRAKGPVNRSLAGSPSGIRKIIFVDEAKISLAACKRTSSLGNPLQELAEQGRKFGVGVLMASQSISDFSDEITNNVGYFMAMPSFDVKERKRIGERLGVPVDMVANGWPKGVALVRLSTGNFGFVQVPEMPSSTVSTI